MLDARKPDIARKFYCQTVSLFGNQVASLLATAYNETQVASLLATAYNETDHSELHECMLFNHETCRGGGRRVLGHKANQPLSLLLISSLKYLSTVMLVIVEIVNA